MIILFLGPQNSPLLKWLIDQDETIIQATDIITPTFIDQNNIDFLISYGYQHILKKDILDKFPNRAINLHISYLPWNRGADPNLWSFIEDTPKGVTIHYLDEGIDTGDIIAQQKIIFGSAGETLANTYQKLQLEVQKLFKEYWPQIKAETCSRAKQLEHGTFHTAKDGKDIIYSLTNGWDTPTGILGRS